MRTAVVLVSLAGVFGAVSLGSPREAQAQTVNAVTPTGKGIGLVHFVFMAAGDVGRVHHQTPYTLLLKPTLDPVPEFAAFISTYIIGSRICLAQVMVQCLRGWGLMNVADELIAQINSCIPATFVYI